MHKLLHTIKYLKLQQIYMRIFYIIRKQFRKFRTFEYKLSINSVSNKLLLSKSIFSLTTYADNRFIFLNKSHIFKINIDWNFALYGKLWTYNLTYFDYLNQENMTKKRGLVLVNDFIEQISYTEDGLEPFPVSLRGINWIKFLSKYEIQDKKIDNSLYAQYEILVDNLEYHLLGNHLLENGFSLLFAAYYFKDEAFYTKAKKILIKELDEQILNDGAHFELSPMYHQIMLYRVLDCTNLVKNNNWKDNGLLELLINKAEIMLGWLNTITYENGNIPLLNDSAYNIAPTAKQLNQYAITLNSKLKIENSKLSDSGYRKVKNECYEMIMDVGNIGPDYIPGHAHSDTFNFELCIERKPFIVDIGLSTYETNERRTLERSTSSHNTVELNNMDQSEVWGGFRVANRAYIVDIKESDDFIRATHDGYKKRLDALHQREFLFEDNKIKIIDTIISDKENNAIARLHFYPGIEPIIINDGLLIDNIKIKIKGSKFKIKEYNYAPEFNKLIKAKMLEIPFRRKLEIEINL